AVVAAECACGGDGDIDAIRVALVEHDRVQAHAACAGLPELPLGGAQGRQLLPGPAAVGRVEQRRVLDTRIAGVRVRQRRLEMPDALELPRTRRAVVPEVLANLALVREEIALARRELTGARHLLAAGDGPGPAAVVRALHDLAEPAAGLRGVDPLGIRRRAL